MFFLKHGVLLKAIDGSQARFVNFILPACGDNSGVCCGRD